MGMGSMAGKGADNVPTDIAGDHHRHHAGDSPIHRRARAGGVQSYPSDDIVRTEDQTSELQSLL